MVGLLNLIFTLAYWILRIGSWVVFLYVILCWIIPQNKYVQLVGKYLEPILQPIRDWLQRRVSFLQNTSLDFSPAVLFLLITVAGWVLSLLHRILL